MQDKFWRNLSFSLAVVLSLIILFRPGGTGLLPFPAADKVIHLGTFALLALTAWWRLGRPRRIFSGLAVYALVSEVIQQLFIPRRSFDLADIAADLAGAFAILWAVRDKS